MVGFPSGTVRDEPDWESLAKATFVEQPQCWTHCGGGFCCSNAHPDFDFQLLPIDGTTLLYMEHEYAHLAASGEVLDTPAQRLSLDFGGPRPLTVVHVPCRLLGACDGVITKPLLCRLYPFLPVFDADGDLVRVCPASIFEVTFDACAAETPCAVRDREERYTNLWMEQEALLTPLKHPTIMLYLYAAGAFLDIYRRLLLQRSDLIQLQGKAFWQKWELAYLTGQLIDVDQIAEQVGLFYKQLVERHGFF